VQSHKNRAGATYSSRWPWPNLFPDSVSFCFKNAPTQLLIEIGKPKITALCCRPTPLIHHPLHGSCTIVRAWVLNIDLETELESYD